MRRAPPANASAFDVIRMLLETAEKAANAAEWPTVLRCVDASEALFRNLRIDLERMRGRGG